MFLTNINGCGVRVLGTHGRQHRYRKISHSTRTARWRRGQELRDALSIVWRWGNAKLLEGTCGARPDEFLTSLVQPEVGNPFGAGKDGAGGVPRHLVALAVPEEVVPEGGGAALGPQRHPHLREDGGTAVVHVRHVGQPRRDAVARAQALERVLLFSLR